MAMLEYALRVTLWVPPGKLVAYNARKGRWAWDDNGQAVWTRNTRPAKRAWLGIVDLRSPGGLRDVSRESA